MRAVPDNKFFQGVTPYKMGYAFIHPAYCPKGMHGSVIPGKDCDICSGASRDPMPWTELFPNLRKEWRARKK